MNIDQYRLCLAQGNDYLNHRRGLFELQHPGPYPSNRRWHVNSSFGLRPGCDRERSRLLPEIRLLAGGNLLIDDRIEDGGLQPTSRTDALADCGHEKAAPNITLPKLLWNSLFR
jgi:hypothetical protein